MVERHLLELSGITRVTNDKELNREELLKKIEDCPSERCKEAMKESLNKENSTSEKNG